MNRTGAPGAEKEFTVLSEGVSASKLVLCFLGVMLRYFSACLHTFYASIGLPKRAPGSVHSDLAENSDLSFTVLRKNPTSRIP